MDMKNLGFASLHAREIVSSTFLIYPLPWLTTLLGTAACMAVHYVTSKGPYAKVLGRVDSATLEMAPVSPG